MTEFQLPECDYCESTEGIRQIGEDKVCPVCESKGVNRVNNPPISINEVLTKSREIDSRVTVRTDLFNAATVSIIDLKKSIDDDETITNKPYTLAVELQTRFNHHKQVIFELNEKVVEESNKQKAIQIYLNQLANQLRADEREKLKISDINYSPRPIKLPVNAKTIRLTKQRIDKVELRKRAAELGVPEFTLQMIIVQKGITVEQAFQLMKANIEQAKAKANITESK